MKKAALVLAMVLGIFGLFILTGMAYAESWVHYATIPDGTRLYYDESSVDHYGDFIQVWTRNSNDLRAKWIIYLTDKTVVLDYIKDIPNHIERSTSGFEPWEPIIPNSTMDRLYRILKDKKPGVDYPKKPESDDFRIPKPIPYMGNKDLTNAIEF